MFLTPGFPIWNCLEPLQARNVAYCNNMRPPSRLARRNLFHFLLPVPISGFLPLQYKAFKLLGRAERLLCADLSSCSHCFGLRRAGMYQPPLTAGGGNANRSIRSRIVANNLRGQETGAGPVYVLLGLPGRRIVASMRVARMFLRSKPGYLLFAMSQERRCSNATRG